ncbi:MAG: hypothetical protein KAT10_06925, partial [Sulfurimonas sp.]|nr:hypothetical protein [Sulfurimonas sp.]
FMKTIRLSRLFLGAVLFLSVGFTAASAEGMKCGAGKCGASMKTPKVKDESTKWDSKKYDANKVTPKVYEKQEWIKQDSQVEYQRGAISTH